MKEFWKSILSCYITNKYHLLNLPKSIFILQAKSVYYLQIRRAINQEPQRRLRYVY